MTLPSDTIDVQPLLLLHAQKAAEEHQPPNTSSSSPPQQEDQVSEPTQQQQEQESVDDTQPLLTTTNDDDDDDDEPTKAAAKEEDDDPMDVDVGRVDSEPIFDAATQPTSIAEATLPGAPAEPDSASALTAAPPPPGFAPSPFQQQQTPQHQQAYQQHVQYGHPAEYQHHPQQQQPSPPLMPYVQPAGYGMMFGVPVPHVMVPQQYQPPPSHPNYPPPSYAAHHHHQQPQLFYPQPGQQIFPHVVVHYPVGHLAAHTTTTDPLLDNANQGAQQQHQQAALAVPEAASQPSSDPTPEAPKQTPEEAVKPNVEDASTPSAACHRPTGAVESESPSSEVVPEPPKEQPQPQPESHPEAIQADSVPHGKPKSTTLQLMAMLTIERSHYVSWLCDDAAGGKVLFFDSMADRVDPINIPCVREARDVALMLKMAAAARNDENSDVDVDDAARKKRLVEEIQALAKESADVKRVMRDLNMCIYKRM
jgi:hypothetical protein